MVAQEDWTTLKGISFTFQRHSKKLYNDAARIMNNAYSDLIIEQEFESLFTDIKKTDLKPDAFTLLKTIIKTSITDEAIKTKDPVYKVSFVTRLVDSTPFIFHMNGKQCKLRNLDQFSRLLNHACNSIGTDYYASIEFGIDDLYFAYDFVPRNLEDISFDDVFDPAPGQSL